MRRSEAPQTCPSSFFYALATVDTRVLGMDVPTATSLDEVYPKDSLLFQGQRWNTLLEQFKAKYDRPADFVSRSPGRVNIIGEVRDSLS